MSAPTVDSAPTRATGQATAPAPSDARSPHGAAPGGSAERRRPWLVPLVVLALVAALGIMLMRGFYQDGLLEPGSPTPQGGKAVAEVLDDLGTDVEVQRRMEDAAAALREGRTVVITNPSGLSHEQLELLDAAQQESDARLVLIAPDLVTLSYLTPDVFPSGALHTKTVVPAGGQCGNADFRARSLAVHGTEGLTDSAILYRTSGDASSCFHSGNGALVAVSGDIVVLGSADLLTNEGVRDADNAALALNTLGESGELTWYLPSASDPLSSTTPTLLDHLPRWAGPVTLWGLLVAAVALLALGRRFGPVVVEPLPVTVRPQELVLGRARLLHRADARDAAAQALRSACAVRLAERLGLRRSSGLDALLAALSPHTSSTPEQLRRLLGPTPVTSDQALLALAADLDRLLEETDR